MDHSPGCPCDDGGYILTVNGFSELMRRAKSKRILVLTLKSMMTQLQKEMWKSAMNLKKGDCP